VCGGRRLLPPFAVRVPALLVAVALPLACTRTGDAPASRADSGRGPESAPPRAESSAFRSPLADSVAAADARFQTARTGVNRDARALDARSAQRRSPDYAKAYDELRRRTLAAESLRADRDALRARLRRAAERDSARRS